VLDIKDFFLVEGYSERYTALTDGIAVMPKLAANLNGTPTASPSAEPQTGQAVVPPGTKVYKIGDFGPAGGLVFYDKGTFSNGWRYLEAAPAETEFKVQWGAYKKEVSGTNAAVGSGKRNTQVIVERLRQFGEAGRAAQVCAGLDFDGFKDWFLPSKDELDLMYKNLKAKGLGSFQSSWYWSSSEIGSFFAWYQDFSNGSQESIYLKGNTYCVRAVRAF
jgi:hypothetical protein